MKAVSLELIRLYQRVAPLSLRSACRYEPTCSNYALLAIEKHGVLRGWSAALKRICRCRPPNGGTDYP
ncbi:membrane protein insertion efficiency factor YidD [Pseudomonas japonica]|uniref:membrane protein insertion efficiency factor YidD n=1 Tax=Pseudomonas japonica TaxID=256466 RepID=UPI000A01B88A|nr:membrane protein insertion efficiency factor YidD [Pseudomonas japonica]